MTLLVFLLALLLPATSLAGSWDQTRANIVEPLNAALHSHWPEQLQARQLDVLMQLYSTETGSGLRWEDTEPVPTSGTEAMLRWTGLGGEEPLRERYSQLLALFPQIERAELRIERVDWRNPTPLGYRATVHLVVKGRGNSGERLQLDQYATLRVRHFDPFWEITEEEITRRTLVSESAPRFAAVAAGIHNTHANVESPVFRIFGKSEDNPVRQGSGVAVGDVNGDGCEDLVLAGSPDLVFYQSRCDGSFEDRTAAVGLPSPYPSAASGVVFFDYDNDGWQDLFVAAVAGGDRLYHNQGDGTFVDVTERAGIPQLTWGSMPVVADYDRDGFLDIYIARMGDHENSVPRPSHNARNGVRGNLLRNRGDGSFEDVSKRAGVDSRGWDMAAAWGDYDGDGWPDLYVANEFGDNRLYRNRGDGSFEERTQQSGTSDGGAGMGVDWGDFDGDGDLDLYVSGMHANSGWTLLHPDFPMPIPWYFKFLGLFTDAVQERADLITDRLSRGSTLFRNNGDGTFSDISNAAGVRDGQWGWAVQFLDYDNDGHLDLYAANGFVTGPLEDDV